tara:strand:+ start:7490 stop:7804 length:315 start_codon:yes stop_codon:yes gene_type:complete
MVVKLIEVIKTNKFMSENGSLSRENYILREVFVNPAHVVCLREDGICKKLLMENRLLDDLDKNQSFTKVYLNRGQAGIELTVIGEPSSVQEKLGLTTQKQLLRG